MQLTDDQKKTLHEVFTTIYDNSESAKALTSSNKDLLKTLTESLQVEGAELRDAYSYWKKFHEKGTDTLENVVTLFEAVKDQ